METKAYAAGVMALLIGCASIEPVTQVSAQTNQLSVEDLLAWPLAGDAGFNKTIVALREVIEVRELNNPGQFSGQGPAAIADGYVLSFANFTPAHRIASIGVAHEPCFPTSRAAKATGAIASHVTEDAHGVDVGQTYSVVRNGARLTFATTKSPYECLDSIHIAKDGQR